MNCSALKKQKQKVRLLMGNPLSYLNEKDLLLNILKNIEHKIMESTMIDAYDDDEECQEIEGNLDIKFWFENTDNWVKVKTFITARSSKGGSTSAHQMCDFLGIKPNGKTFFEEDLKTKTESEVE
jgi:hypothetical protein